MLKISKNDKQLAHLPPQTLAQAGFLERYDLQESLFNCFDAFCEEIQESLAIVGKEIRPSEVVQDQIDLLAIDGEGNAVIIELKRGNDKLQLLQAIGYAAMISKWNPEHFKKEAGDRWAKIEDLLAEGSEVDTDDMNQSQRIILIAEQFDYEVLVAAEWLHDGYDVDISCVRLDLAVDDKGAPTKSEYLALTQVYPTKGLEEIAVTRGRRRQTSGGATSTHPEFLAAIAAYNDSAPPDVPAEGKSNHFRNIHPGDWPRQNFLHYTFSRKARSFVILLSVHPNAPEGFGELLAPFDGKPIANGQASLVWDQDHNEGRGRLLATFPSTTPVETVVEGMRDLVAMTHTAVSNKLKAIQAEDGSTGN